MNTISAMKKTSVAAISILLVVLMSLFGLSACGGSFSPKSGSVAASVNDVKIYENEITNYIKSKTLYAYCNGSKETWANYLNQMGYTVEDFRNGIVDIFVNRQVILQTAKNENYSANEDEINESIHNVKSQFSSEDAWLKSLKDAGWDSESAYKSDVIDGVIYDQYMADHTSDCTASDEEIIASFEDVRDTYNGMKRSSHILFSADDEETAKDVLGRINAGTISFDEAAKQYSTDTGSASKGGDVGWDKMTTFVTEYQEALNGLGKGQTSDLVSSSYGFHIIRCTDTFDAPSSITSTSVFPEDLLTTIKKTADNKKYDSWIGSLKENMNIVINNMPTNVEYYVDVSKYQSGSTGSVEVSPS